LNEKIALVYIQVLNNCKVSYLVANVRLNEIYN
jgi:hypothetical protein